MLYYEPLSMNHEPGLNKDKDVQECDARKAL